MDPKLHSAVVMHQMRVSWPQTGKSLAKVRQHTKLLGDLEASRGHFEVLKRRLEPAATSAHDQQTAIAYATYDQDECRRAQGAEQQARSQEPTVSLQLISRVESRLYISL